MADGFKFSLDKLLDIRRQKEEESERAFTESQKAKAEVEEKLKEMEESREKYKGINPKEDIVYQKLKRYYLQGLEIGIENTEKELAKREKEVNKCRQDLVEKQLDRKTVETLREKKKAEFLKEQERIEQVNLDELALYSFIRKQQEDREVEEREEKNKEK